MSYNHTHLIKIFKDFIPKLTSDLHKGQCGRIGVVGGSKEYTGAPYFCGYSALRVGADLCYIIASKDSSSVIKTYSPELIVFPILDNPNNEIDFYTIISKLHSLLIGPGMGRSEISWTNAKTALQCAKKQNIPIVLDADALFMINYDLDLIKGYKKCILTPNKVEFQRLYESTFQNEKYDLNLNNEDDCERVKMLALKLGEVTILKKGQIDIMSNGIEVLYSDAEGSNRRCGGQGDILSGIISLFAHWSHSQTSNHPNSTLIATYAASILLRATSKSTFSQFHRSMLTTDLLKELPNQFRLLFES